MLTLQILDQDQVFFHSLDRASTLLGSDERADVRLSGEGVVPQHARIECVGEQSRLVAVDGEIVRNGKVCRDVVLALGDRLELGSTVVVIGQSVSRQTGPDDVLASVATRARSQRLQKSSRSRWIPLAAAVLAGAGLLYLALVGDSPRPPAGFASLQRLGRSGSFDQAHKELASLREWAGRDQQRQALVAGQERSLQAIEEAVEVWRRRVADEADDRSYAELNLALRRDEKRAAEEHQRIAARIVRASLSELLREAEEASRRDYRQRLASGELARPDDPGASGAGSASAGAGLEATATRVGDVSRVLGDAERLAGLGLYGQAMGAVRAAIAGAGRDQMAMLQRRAQQLRTDALVALARLLDAARQRAGSGDVAGAIDDLVNSRHRFPGGSDFEGMRQLLWQLREQQAAELAAGRRSPVLGVAGVGSPGTEQVDETARPASFATIAVMLEQVQAHELDGEFVRAETLARGAGEQVRSRDPDFAGRLELRADEFALLAALHAHVGERLDRTGSFDVSLSDGRIVRVQAVDGSKLLATTTDGEQELTWLDLTAPSVGLVVDRFRLGGRPLLGAAMLLYRDGEADQAEQLLARALRADAGLKGLIDRAIARGRGETLDSDGYTLGKEGFRSRRQIEAGQVAARLIKQLASTLRKNDPAVREAYLREVLSGGPLVVAPVAAALRRSLEREIAQLQRSALSKQVDKLDSRRQLVDEARQHAKELIFDEQRYFYPFKPPQVSSSRFAEYQSVQAEVNRRTARLHELWNDRKIKVKVPKMLQASLDRLEELVAMLDDCRQSRGIEFADIEWARALPPGDSVTVGSYCRTVAEREQYEVWQRIERYNSVVSAQLSSGECAQLRITNDYRLMFGHRPLALHPRIAEAARGHADEMAELGYFSHFSPTPGRRTPFDRMAKAGYDFGVSENLAAVGSASSAHHAWCRSSGHHRNLLWASHSEFGIGNAGRLWVQNFGGGTDHRASEAWRQAGAR